MIITSETAMPMALVTVIMILEVTIINTVVANESGIYFLLPANRPDKTIIMVMTLGIIA